MMAELPRNMIHAVVVSVAWMHKFTVAAIGCRISHKDTKHPDKCSNKKT
jgi:hypothetical protein